MKFLIVALFAFLPTIAFAGSFDLNCSDEAKTISLTRDELKLGGKSYLHSGSNELFDIADEDFKIELQLAKKKGVIALHTKEILSEVHESDCRDTDSYKLAVDATVTLKGKSAQNIALICDSISVSTRGGQSCD